MDEKWQDNLRSIKVLYENLYGYAAEENIDIVSVVVGTLGTISEKILVEDYSERDSNGTIKTYYRRLIIRKCKSPEEGLENYAYESNRKNILSLFMILFACCTH